MKDKDISKFANGEKVNSKLGVMKKALNSDFFNGAIAVVFSLVMIGLSVGLFYTKNSTNSKEFILLIVIGCILFLLGLYFISTALLQILGAGLVLTDTKIIGKGGYPILKKIDVNIADIEEIEVVEEKKNGYFLKIGKKSIPNMENPNEFIEKMNDLKNNQNKISE